MKENDLLPNLFDTKTFLNDRNRRGSKPSEKPVFSPRLITRKKDKKELPVNPFARRKTCQETNSVLRYMSFKKGHSNEENLTFLSDDNSNERSEFCPEQSMFDLHFSRINTESFINEDSECHKSKNLFDDINDSKELLSIDSSRKEKSERFSQIDSRISENEIKSELSLETMSESPNLKESIRNEERLNILLRENKKLKKEIISLTEENVVLKVHNEEMTIKIKLLEESMEEKISEIKKEKEILDQRLLAEHANFTDKVTELESSVISSEEKHKFSHEQLEFCKNQMIQMEETNEMLEKECLQKEHYLKSLNEEIEELRVEIEEKNVYSKCLEDVILELNGKIDKLKGFSEEQNAIVEEKMERIEVLEIEKDMILRDMRKYEKELTFCQETINSLIQENTKNQKEDISQSQEQNRISNEELTELRNQVFSLHIVIDKEKEQNEKLKKEISYKLIELDFHKKNSYQHEKHTLEIATLKDRNKRLTKKLNQVIEEFETFKEKSLLTNKKNMKKNSQIQNSQSSHFTEVENLSQEKLFVESQNKKNTSNRVNNHQIEVIDCQRKNKNFKYDSDDELSFKLSPEKY